MTMALRRMGLEQEFFLVDAVGELSHQADDFLAYCHRVAAERGCSPQYFVPEFVKSMVEINTRPAYSVAELARNYLQNLHLALQVARELDLRLYPLSSYPLHIMPVMRDKPNYHAQSRTLGYERSLHAGKCTGTHLHLEAPPGVIDARMGVSYHSTDADRLELLNLYNLATALDAALIALSRACPFYEGQAVGLASHTIRYRGSEVFGWEGVFTHLQLAGGLSPYADSIETLVELQFERHYCWLAAMDAAGVERAMFLNAGGNLLESAWNPIRLNQLGTVEIRCIDSNYPEVVLALMKLVSNLAGRIRDEKITVKPQPGLRTFEQDGDTLWVPDYAFLNGDLLYAAATEGIRHELVSAYVDSILAFALTDGSEGTRYLMHLKQHLQDYKTVEVELLKTFLPTTAELSRAAGLKLVQQCCDHLEQQVEFLNQAHPFAQLDAMVEQLSAPESSIPSFS